MNKKIISILIVILLIVTILPTVNSTYKYNVKKSFNGIDIDEEGLRSKKYDEINLKCAVMSDPPIPLDPSDASPKPIVTTVPNEFSWKNYNGKDWTTPAKNQGQCGSCWAFAAIETLESIINIREDHADLDPDLSEQYVLSCLPESGSCRGGDPYEAFLYMMETTSQGNYHNGALFESCFPYQANDEVPCSDKCENWEEFLVPILDCGYWHTDGSSEDIEAIKTQVMETGPVTTFMMATDNFKEWWLSNHDPEDYYPYPGHVQGINHCVEIVGWKDDSSIGNGGYWIVKNSWGKYWGYDGFFNIEYGSLHIDDYMIVWVDYDPESFDWAPIANPGGPYLGDVGQEIAFDASASFDPENDIVSYHWDFGDGDTDTGINSTHIYSQRGAYSVTLTVTDETGKQGIEETSALINLWMKDDSWIYTFDDVYINLDQDGQTISLQGAIENLALTVTDDTGDSYRLDFNGKIRGEFEVSFNAGIISGHLSKSTNIDGSILFRQSDLGVEEINAHIKGMMILSIGTFPIPIPVPFDIDIEMKFDTAFELLDFPLHVNKVWDLPSTSVFVDGKIKSIMLNVLNFINKISGQTLLPPEIAGLLPIIDIGDTLENFGVENPIRVPVIPNVECIDEQEVTVEAGTYNAYEIYVPPLINYHYAPAVNNIIKISVEMEEFSTPYGELTFVIHGELVSANYGG